MKTWLLWMKEWDWTLEGNLPFCILCEQLNNSSICSGTCIKADYWFLISMDSILTFFREIVYFLIKKWAGAGLWVLTVNLL